MIHVDCPRCAYALQLPDHRAGTVLRCPECEERLRAPVPGFEPAIVPPRPRTSLGARLGSGLVVFLAAVPLIGAFTLFGHGSPLRTTPPVAEQALPEPVEAKPIPALPQLASGESVLETSVGTGP
jgi:hypothetical protein